MEPGYHLDDDITDLHAERGSRDGLDCGHLDPWNQLNELLSRSPKRAPGLLT